MGGEGASRNELFGILILTATIHGTNVVAGTAARLGALGAAKSLAIQTAQTRETDRSAVSLASCPEATIF